MATFLGRYGMADRMYVSATAGTESSSSMFKDTSGSRIAGTTNRSGFLPACCLPTNRSVSGFNPGPAGQCGSGWLLQVENFLLVESNELLPSVRLWDEGQRKVVQFTSFAGQSRADPFDRWRAYPGRPVARFNLFHGRTHRHF